MYTPSDGDWIREARNREVYQASEARWLREGVTIAAPQTTGVWLGKLKNLLMSLKPSHSADEPTRVSPKGELPTASKHSA